jgi:acyl carrier protein
MPSPSPTARASSPADVDPAEVVEEMQRIAARELELPAPLGPQSHLVRDLALDSLGLTVLAVGLENRFRIHLREEDAQGVETVSDLAALVVRRIREEAAG